MEIANTPARVLLLHSNDLHSRLEQAAKMSAYITEARRSYGEDLLVLDIGDHMDRMRLETEGSDGLVNIALLNEAGYDAVTLGNNEGLTYSHHVLDRAYGEEARFQVLCANLIEAATGQPPEWMQAHTIIDKGGLRFGIIGLTAAFSMFYDMLGWSVLDPVACCAEQVELLRPKVDCIIVLSHLGLSFDKRMAEEIEGIDLILGGHTHHLLEEPLRLKETTICAAGRYGEYLGRVEITGQANGGKVTIEAECVPMAAFHEDPEAAAIISGYRETGIRRMSRVIASLEAAVPAYAERESPLGNMLAAALRRWTEAEIGIVNAGQLLGGLAKGDVTEAQLHALCPSPINPCRMQLTGSQIRQALEESLLDENIHKPIFGFGFRGLILGTLAVDGLTVHYDPEAPPMHRIRRILASDGPLQDSRCYSVGTISMFSFGIGYHTLQDNKQPRFYLPEFLRDLLAGELRDPDAITESNRERWVMV
ncbi:bifunctional metallophosphatase/5'-nucleotidase [Paenibacillus sambharensis]|uniref:Bifunctional metallophosphatase/5'-nucleotidase n=1 Tax=Paenibacillus sambharensis TaxID=1803190 RepID=A0A2W1L4H6_9BACL|nr:bifunctional UDP-sugar hydrolase/5'-nucleotidase [Paenibacillus sambharensis]PZD94266.1 bifunctional metallophosphatase/5'-nucleotidase [Paenibacillus sambharensis]